MLRSIASPSGCIGCMAVLAGMAAMCGYTCVVLILLTRHLTSSPPAQTLPLYFDYSSPADATATVDLGSELVPFPKPSLLHQYSHMFTTPAANLSDGSQKQLQQRKAQDQEQHRLPPPPFCTQEEQHSQYAVWQPSGPGSGPRGRILSPEQQVKISVELLLPSYPNDLFQLSGQLVSNSGTLLERAVRTHLTMDQPMLRRYLRQLVLAPCVAVGWCSDAVKVTFVLFESYTEQQAPLQVFRAQLSSRQSVAGILPPPAVMEADLKIELQMGAVRSLIYWLRPSFTVTVVLASLATLLALAASATSMFLLLVCLLVRVMTQPQPEPAPAPVPVPAPVAVPARLLFPSFRGFARKPGRAAAAVVGNGSAFPGRAGAPAHRGAHENGENGAHGEHDGAPDDADLQWQLVGDEQYHEVDEVWN